MVKKFVLFFNKIQFISIYYINFDKKIEHILKKLYKKLEINWSKIFNNCLNLYNDAIILIIEIIHMIFFLKKKKFYKHNNTMKYDNCEKILNNRLSPHLYKKY